MKISYRLMSFCSILVLLLISCNIERVGSEGREGSDLGFEESVKLELIDQLVLRLDSTAGPDSFMLQYLRYEGEPSLAYLNSVDRTIRLFNIDNGRQRRKIAFDKSGPNAVLYTAGFSIHNSDSVFLTDGYKTTYLVNSSSELSRKYPSGDASLLKYAPGPLVQSSSPMIFDDSKLYFQGYVGGVFDQPNMVRLNLENDSISYFNGYPIFYQEAYWRGGFEYMSYTYNKQERFFAFSFSADHNIQVIHLNNLNKVEEYVAKGSGFSELNPPRLKMGDPGGDQDVRKFMTQNSYGNIYYDFINDLYKRFAYLAISDSDYDSNDELRSKKKPARIIILDKEFNKVGEQKLERFKYNLNMVFVGPKGLYIKLMDDLDEDSVTFDILSPKSL